MGNNYSQSDKKKIESGNEQLKEYNEIGEYQKEDDWLYNEFFQDEDEPWWMKGYNDDEWYGHR